MRKLSIVSLVLFIFIFILLTVSFARSWYHHNGRNRDNPSQFIGWQEFYPTKVKIINTGSADGNYSFEEFFGFKATNFKNIFSASLAFSILAWVCTIVMILLSLLDVVEFKLPPIGKFLGFAVFLFTLLSFLIFLGAPAAALKDCKKEYSDCESNDLLHKGFFGKNSIIHYGPSSGWNVIPISCAIALVVSIYNIVFFAKESSA